MFKWRIYGVQERIFLLFKQNSSKYREVSLISLGCRSLDLWIDIYKCSLIDKLRFIFFYTCFCFEKKKNISGEKRPFVYNVLVVRILTHEAKEIDFKPSSDWWGLNPQTDICWGSTPNIWSSSILDDRVKSTFLLSSWSCFLPLWRKEYTESESMQESPDM